MNNISPNMNNISPTTFLPLQFPPALRDPCLKLLHFHCSESLSAAVDDVFNRTRPPPEEKEKEKKEEKKEGGEGEGKEGEKEKKDRAPRHPIRNKNMLRAFAVEHVELKEVRERGKRVLFLV